MDNNKRIIKRILRKTYTCKYYIEDIEMITDQILDTKKITLTREETLDYVSRYVKTLCIDDFICISFDTYNKNKHKCFRTLKEDLGKFEKWMITAAKFDMLSKIVSPAQRSEQWYERRETRITASDGGTIIGVNKYEPQWKFVQKKVQKHPFPPNPNCYHGTKYEKIATMLYEDKYNVCVQDFGLICHPTIPFLAASPDGIIGKYKKDGETLETNVGRMLEIKCPVTRNIRTDGDLYGDICPKYYWVQMQLQLECCDLDECDFWQCKIHEYEDREEYTKDNDDEVDYISETSKQDKGLLIQLLPLEEFDKNITDVVVYEKSKFIYPPRLKMTLNELDEWIKSVKIDTGYKIHKILYWRIDFAHCALVLRDKNWFKTHLSTYATIWSYVDFLRKNKEVADMMFKYIDALKRKTNKHIIDTIAKVCTPSSVDYDIFINKLRNGLLSDEESEPEEVVTKSTKERILFTKK